MRAGPVRSGAELRDRLGDVLSLRRGLRDVSFGGLGFGERRSARCGVLRQGHGGLADEHVVGADRGGFGGSRGGRAQRLQLRTRLPRGVPGGLGGVSGEHRARPESSRESIGPPAEGMPLRRRAGSGC